MLVLFFVIVSSTSTLASEPAIEEGFKAFKEHGVEAAWKIWAKGGPLDGSKELMSQISQFGQIGAYYGNYNSHEYVSSKELGPKNKIVFVIMNLDKGPLFGRFLVFLNPEGNWIIPSFKFHTDPEQIWPTEVFTN